MTKYQVWGQDPLTDKWIIIGFFETYQEAEMCVMPFYGSKEIVEVACVGNGPEPVTPN